MVRNSINNPKNLMTQNPNSMVANGLNSRNLTSGVNGLEGYYQNQSL